MWTSISRRLKRQRRGHVGLLCLALMICQATQKSLWFWKLTFGPQLSNYLGHHPWVWTVHNDVFWAQGQGLKASENLDWRQEVKTGEGERADPLGMCGCLEGDSARALGIRMHPLQTTSPRYCTWALDPNSQRMLRTVRSYLEGFYPVFPAAGPTWRKTLMWKAPAQQAPQASPAVCCNDHPVI